MFLPALLSAAVIAGLSIVPRSTPAVLPARGFGPVPVPVAPPRTPAASDWWRNGGPRIRLMDDRSRSVLADGLRRSSLLRSLVARVESDDVIVYVEMDRQLDRSLSGRLVLFGAGLQFRYVRVTIDPDQPSDHVIASLAHELRHVVEVIEHPSVEDDAGLALLYRRIGHQNRASGRPGWETDAARQVTDDVRRELSAGGTVLLARRAADQQ